MPFSRFVILLFVLFSATAFAGRGEFVHIENGEKIFIHFQPAERGQPTVVLLNGLTYSLNHWDAYVKSLRRLNPGLGVLRFDMIGMGETLLNGKLPVSYAIPHSAQVELTKKLMDHFGIRKAYIVGLSYGGAIAVAFAQEYPAQVEQLILMAPFTEPLTKMDTYIRGQVRATRLMFPMNPATDDELYDFYLRQFIYAVYPSLEPTVLENPYKLEAIFRMIQGIRKVNTLGSARRLPDHSTHLIVADQDQYLQKDMLDRFWNAVPRAARASRIDITQTEHKIPEAIPDYAAAWTLEILSGRNELNRGLSFQGNTYDFSAKAKDVEISLPRK